LFVIRNAGNIIPPYGATNGGEGATIEYAVQALDIRQIIVCGHSHCGAMKGLMKLNSLREEMPLVHDWLKYAEATRRLVKDHYSQYQGEELLEIVTAENVLTQIENLRTYPVIRSKLYTGQLNIYAWIYNIEKGEVLAFDQERHAYVLPQNQLKASEIDETLVTEELSNGNPIKTISEEEITVQQAQEVMFNAQRFPITRLSKEQAERIYRGSASN
jgi:carbonic anhydrase